MSKKLSQALFVLGLMLAPLASYGENHDSSKNIDEIKQNAPELILKEEDFTYKDCKDKLEFIKSILREYENGKKYDPDLERNYIGIPNSLLTIQGYLLFTQRDIIRLKLENAILKKAAKDVVSGLEKDLTALEKQIKVFLSENIWVD